MRRGTLAVGRAGALVGCAGALVGRAASLVGRAGALVVRAASLVGRAGALVGRAGALVAASRAAVVLPGLAGPVGAAAATAKQTIALLNIQRAANQLPAGITENPTWSTDCAAHDRYMASNHMLTHNEIPGNPGYSSAGAYAGKRRCADK